MNKGEMVVTGRGDKRHQMVDTFVYLMVFDFSFLRSGTVDSILFPPESLFVASIPSLGKGRIHQNW